MRLLDRYLLRELLIPLGYCLGGFLIFWVSFDLLTTLKKFQKANLGAGDVAEYYWALTPEMLVLVIPIALLLALLYALTNHARHHELTAMRAAGVSMWRLCLPYLLVGSLFSAGMFLLNEHAVPDGAETAEEILTRRLANQPKGADRLWQKNLLFVNAPAGRTWRIGAYHVKTHEMRELQIDWRFPDGSHKQINADRATRTNRTWLLTNLTEQAYPPGASTFPTITKTARRLMPELTETPKLIKSEIKISRLSESVKNAKKAQLSIDEIKNYLQLHPRLPPDLRAILETKLHSRYAAPWTCLVVVLIAVPFGAPSGRRNVFVGVAASVFICFVYFVLCELSMALGSGGRLEPWIAAWAPNIVFGLAGLILTQRVR